jgi:hypothetical protein
MTILELAIQNLPPRFRALERWQAWVKVLVSPSVFLHNAFNNYVNSERYKLSFNSQVIYLEHRLNDALDTNQRRIYIADTLDAQVIQTVIYRKTDRQPSSLIFRKTDNAGANRAIIWRKDDLNYDADFVVFIPIALNTEGSIREIKNIVNYYRVAGRRFVIQTF